MKIKGYGTVDLKKIKSPTIQTYKGYKFLGLFALVNNSWYPVYKEIKYGEK